MLIPYAYAPGFVALSLIVLFFFFLFLLSNLKCEDDCVPFSFIMSIICTALLVFLFVAPDDRTRTEKFQVKLNESNMTVDDMVYLDEGKIFKFDGVFYIKTNSGEVLTIQSSDAEKVYK